MVHPEPLQPDDIFFRKLFLGSIDQALPLSLQLGWKKLVLKPLDRVALKN
jgi:hypothetical protein